MVGAQASQEQFEKILSYFEVAKQEGAKTLTGGKVEAIDGDLKNDYYIQPTLIKGKKPYAHFPRRDLWPRGFSYHL